MIKTNKKQDKFIKKFIVSDKGKMINEKKGQITIFVIIAIVIVATIILLIAATDIGRGVWNRVTGQEYNVRENLENCILDNKEIDNKISNIMIHGGEPEPEFNYLYDGIEMKYLCYTNKYYSTCINQQPMLLQNTEQEIKNAIELDVRNCVEKIENGLKRSGYDVSSGNFELTIDLVPDNMIIEINYPMTIRRVKATSSMDSFEIKKPSNNYELIILANSIINFEVGVGDSESTGYMVLYPDKKVEKFKQGDGTTIYMLSDRNTKEQFNFASRSVVFPPGYVGT